MNFIHLHTHSHYSLLDGMSKIDALVRRAKELDMPALAITDHGNLYGAIEFYQKAKKAGVKPIIGIEAYIAPKSRFDKENSQMGRAPYYHLILLAKNNTGYKNLIKLATIGHLEGFYYKPRVDKEVLQKHSEGIIALSACYAGEIAQAILKNNAEHALAIAREYENIFGAGNFYLEIGWHPGISETNHHKLVKGLKELSSRTGIPLVATQDSHYLLSEDAKAHDILLAVQTGNKIGDPDRLTLKEDDFSFTDTQTMIERFREVPEAIAITEKIADECNAEIELDKIHIPEFPLQSGENAQNFLKKLCDAKIGKRYESIDGKIKSRLEYELNVIEKMGFAPYFLIVQDFVNWAKQNGIVVGPGRGSAAGSLVSFVLNITDVDPLKYNLLFERFLNPSRISMPDIDLDFTDARRDEVLKYVREKYGNEHVAQIITFGTMAARAAIRDAGRAMGLPYDFCDKFAKLIPWNLKLKEAAEKVPDLKQLIANDQNAKKLFETAHKLEGVVRHASVHACGVVISKDQLTEYVPLQRAPQDPNIIITQYEMHAVESLGLLKMDFLGLRNLTVIENTMNLIKDKGFEIKSPLEISKLNFEDKETYALLQRGETTGVFQLESSGMRRYLKELKPTNIEDITAIVALYRPGPMEIIPNFINRKFGREQVSYPDPRLEKILRNTYGTTVYQEQLMQMAQTIAGFTLPEADTLRKAVGKKITSLLNEQKEKFISGAVKNKTSPAIAEALWKLVEPFERYGFNRSHAISYAFISYWTAYFKAHFPLEFMTALLNSETNDIERMAFLIEEAKKMKIEVLIPDINESEFWFTPISPNRIRFGLAAIKNVGENIVSDILRERIERGPYQSMRDLLERITHKGLNKKSVEALIKAGAFDKFDERARLLVNIEELLRYAQDFRKSRNSSQKSLFGNGTLMKPLTLARYDAENEEKNNYLRWEKELLGLYITGHPLQALKGLVKEVNTDIKQIVKQKPVGLVRALGIVSTIKRIVTKKGELMLFAKIEDENDNIETIIFPRALEKTGPLWQTDNIIIVEGRLSWRDKDPKLICENAWIPK